MAWEKPSKEQVIKVMLYNASLAQERADQMTAAYQEGNRQHYIEQRDAKLDEARRYAQTNGVQDIFKKLTGLP
jgi:hypothetical protein